MTIIITILKDYTLSEFHIYQVGKKYIIIMVLHIHEGDSSKETLVITYKTTRGHDPEDHKQQLRSHENHKSQICNE